MLSKISFPSIAYPTPSPELTKSSPTVFGFAGCIVALIGECITVSIFQRTGHRSAASAAVFFLFLHIACFSSSVDATSYIYASEIFPTPVRAKGLAVSISGLFVATIIFLQCAPTAFEEIGWRYYLVFICITAVIFCLTWFYFPEVCFTTPCLCNFFVCILLTITLRTDLQDAPRGYRRALRRLDRGRGVRKEHELRERGGLEGAGREGISLCCESGRCENLAWNDLAWMVSGPGKSLL